MPQENFRLVLIQSRFEKGKEDQPTNTTVIETFKTASEFSDKIAELLDKIVL